MSERHDSHARADNMREGLPPGGAQDEPPPRVLPTAASAAQPGSAFLEPWMRRVAEVDDFTLGMLLRHLVMLRRLKRGVVLLASVAGGLLFGVLPVERAIHAALIYGTLAAIVALPSFAAATLAVRKLFLEEAARCGLSRSTATLVLTRAERRARFVSPLASAEERLLQLQQAVRDPDVA